MCASYGLGGGPYLGDAGMFDLRPLDEKTSRAALLQWIEEFSGKSKITRHDPKTDTTNFNPIIRQVDEARQLDFAWWFLWIGGQIPKFVTFNARDDKLTKVSSWVKPFQYRRALLPATWYVEKGKTFELNGGELFAMAAIYNVDVIDGAPMISYSMVTRDAVGEALTANDRMPLILPKSMHDEWLNPDRVGDDELVEAAVSSADEISEMVAIQGSKGTMQASLF
ncbi:SOS response-associated peptidase family protein [Leifsonia sp. Root112D2]|uniref:SOS response-associated peptidase family protein n=1 Tax=Leifsonia sp. Root112D2 TaxID=1736426 RepID=UPI0009E866FC|nr:SOS response-associated peptidase family protein [Leifsonia sp. Root112D2]